MPKNNKTRDILNSRIFWMVFSLLVAIVLWAYVTTVEGAETQQTYYGIEVEFQGEQNLRDSRGLIITDVSSNTVNVTLRGRISELSRFTADDLKAVIDVSTVTRTGSFERSYRINYPSNVNSSNIEIVSSTPSSISYYIDQETTKTVELRGSFEGSVAEGYIREEFVFDPASVIIRGPAEEVDRVQYALVTVEQQDLDRTLTYETTFTLVDADMEPVDTDNIVCDLETVSITLPVKATKEVPITVDLIDGGGATSRDAIITSDPETITLAGDPTILEGINSLSVGTIDLSTFDPVITRTFPIVLPNGTESVTGETEVEVTVEVRGLATARRTTTDLNCINTPEGFTVEIVSNSLEVVIRGPEAALSTVMSNNIRAVADLSNITTTGTMAVPVTVYVDSSGNNVGAVGEYRIYVNIERG